PDCTASDVATNSPRSSAASATCAPTPRTLSGTAGAVALAAPVSTHKVPAGSTAARAGRAPLRSPAAAQKRSGSPAGAVLQLAAANQSTPLPSSQLAPSPGKT